MDNCNCRVLSDSLRQHVGIRSSKSVCLITPRIKVTSQIVQAAYMYANVDDQHDAYIDARAGRIGEKPARHTFVPLEPLWTLVNSGRRWFTEIVAPYDQSVLGGVGSSGNRTPPAAEIRWVCSGSDLSIRTTPCWEARFFIIY